MIRNERGFTIMELLVVIVIIGVLAAIGVPAYNNMTKKAKEAACQANKRNIQTAAGMYYADENTTLAVANTTADNKLSGYLSNIKDMKCPYDTAGNTGYTVGIAADGVITVTCNTTHP